MFFLIGIFLFALGNLTFNVFILSFMTQYSRYTQLGDFSAIFLLIFTAYAIIKHQLFNIKVIATETTVIALSIGLLVEVFLSNNFTEGLLKGIVWILATYGGYALIKKPAECCIFSLFGFFQHHLQFCLEFLSIELRLQ